MRRDLSRIGLGSIRGAIRICDQLPSHDYRGAGILAHPVGDLAIIGRSKTAWSASLPGSIEPFREASPRLCPPLMVAAAITSAGVILICVQASESTKGMLTTGDEPGL